MLFAHLNIPMGFGLGQWVFAYSYTFYFFLGGDLNDLSELITNQNQLIV
jgi:hypothetical protein